jgi:hypothetical protein
MKKRISGFILLALILLSCETPRATPQPSSPAPTSSSTPASAPATPSATLSPLPSPTPTPARQADISEVENEVLARASESEDFAPAVVGETIYPGGAIQSGDDGRAALRLLPEETLIRIASNSSFTLEELTPQKDSPFSKLKLLAGQIWILLSGGESQVETPYGVASVRGSMMSVSLVEQILTVTCLEGHCSVQNDAGILELTAGEAVDILAANQLPDAPRPLSVQELQNWAENNTEAQELAQFFLDAITIPTPTLTLPTIPPLTPPPTDNSLGNNG